MNVYDFDGTIYAGDSTVDFYLYALKNHPSLLRFVPKQAAGFLLYGLKKVDKTTLKQYFYSFLQGIPTDELVEKFWEKHQAKIYPWYLQQQTPEDIIISASPDFLLRPICLRLGIQHLIASEVDSQTGTCTGKNCHGQQKVVRFREKFGEAKIDQFYSDSESDLPMAKLANTAFLVKKGTVIPWKIKQTA